MIDIAYARELAERARETLPNANPWEVAAGPPAAVDLSRTDQVGGTCYVMDGDLAHIMACYTWSVPNARFLTWLYNHSNELIGAAEQRERLLVTAGQLVLDVQAARDQAEAAEKRVADMQGSVRYAESLRKRAEDEKASADHRALVNADLTRKLDAAKAQVEKLADALRWYADAYNYARLGDETAIQRDGGVRAVRALGETGDQAVAALVNKEGK